MFPLKVLVPMGIPGSHNLSDHRNQNTGLLAMKKNRGEDGKALLPAPFSPTFTRALTVVAEILSRPRCTHAVDKGQRQ